MKWECKWFVHRIFKKVTARCVCIQFASGARTAPDTWCWDLLRCADILRFLIATGIFFHRFNFYNESWFFCFVFTYRFRAQQNLKIFMVTMALYVNNLVWKPIFGKRCFKKGYSQRTDNVKKVVLFEHLEFLQTRRLWFFWLMGSGWRRG